ncbi:hypothetical protein HanOQP8_Chr09g0313201 [Helianthus annuus]|nr:hypothetical protein HanOQP8_Chr09g0313201 [Helianthus annuus]
MFVEETPRHVLALGNQTSILKQVELALSQESQQNGQKKLRVPPQHRKPHRKATNIPALSLKIGNWEWEAINEGDLVAKFYYGTKKLVWEVLCGSLKKKIEFRWSQISAINAYLDGNQTSRLDIKVFLYLMLFNSIFIVLFKTNIHHEDIIMQLKEPPRLCEETMLNPKMRTKWENSSSDFTGDQTRICSQHTIRFAPRVLDCQFAKLLECDERLSNLTKQPFPYHNQFFFQHQTLDFSCNISIHALVPNKDQKGMSVPYAPILAQPVSSFVGHSSYNLPTPVMKLPSLDQKGNSQIPDIPLTHTEELDHILPNHETDKMNDAENINQETNFKSDPTHQSYEMKSATTVNQGTVFEEHNSFLPVESRNGMDDSSNQGNNHFGYVDDQMLSVCGPFPFEEPNSWLHPEFNLHEFSNGACNGVNHIGFSDDDDGIYINSLWD